jgi:hypothetical protein
MFVAEVVVSNVPPPWENTKPLAGSFVVGAPTAWLAERLELDQAFSDTFQVSVAPLAVVTAAVADGAPMVGRAIEAIATSPRTTAPMRWRRPRTPWSCVLDIVLVPSSAVDRPQGNLVMVTRLT